MVNRKTNDPLNYLGVRASTPSNTVREQRAPTTEDTTGPDGPFILADFWLNVVNQDFYVLTNVSAGVATWKPLN